jgi:hypothetical protein
MKNPAVAGFEFDSNLNFQAATAMFVRVARTSRASLRLMATALTSS